jgi:hypothetical protein
MLQQIRLSVGVVFLLLSIPSMGLAQSVSPSTAPLPSETIVFPDPSTAPTAPRLEPSPASVSQESPETLPISCPAGQFASKFSDVTPDDWAYEAVNRIASGEFRCFPIASPS